MFNSLCHTYIHYYRCGFYGLPKRVITGGRPTRPAHAFVKIAIFTCGHYDHIQNSRVFLKLVIFAGKPRYIYVFNKLYTLHFEMFDAVDFLAHVWPFVLFKKFK